MNYRLIIVMLLLLAGNLLGQYLDWEVVGRMPYPVYGGEAVACDSVIYVLGGYSDSLGTDTDWIQAYYPEKNEWKMIGRMNEKRSNFVALKFKDEILIYGGLREEDSASAVLQRISIKNDQILFTNDTTLKENRVYSSGVIIDSSLVIIGGNIDFTKNVQMDSIYIFAYHLNGRSAPIKVNSLFSLTNNIPIQQMCAVYDDVIYIFGGLYLGISSWIYEFDLSRNAYNKKGIDLVEASAGGRAISGDSGNIYVIGGYNENTSASNTAIKSVEIYNVWSNQVRMDTPLNYPRKEFMAVRYKGELFVFGGKGIDNKVETSIERTGGHQTTTENSRSLIAEKFSLLNCYPNPFNPSTNISFEVSEKGFITLSIYSILGEKVKTLVADYLSPGHHSVQWNGKDDNGNNAASGIYFVNLSNGKTSLIKKAILLK